MPQSHCRGTTLSFHLFAAFYPTPRFSCSIRAYNGQLYGSGRMASGTSSRSKFGPGSIVRMHLEDGKIYLFVNNKPQGVAFTGFTDETLYPAVFFYGSDRAVALLRAVRLEAHDSLPLTARPLFRAFTATPTLAPFDPASSRPDYYEFDEGGRRITSMPVAGSSSVNAIAVINRSFSSTEYGVATFVIEEEVNNNEGCVIGMVFACPPSSWDYNSVDGLLVRGYNGNLLTRDANMRALRTGGSSSLRFRRGDTVRLHWHGPLGKLEFFVNDGEGQALFHNVRDRTVFPAVATYMANRSVRVTRVEVVDRLPAPADPPVAADPPPAAGGRARPPRTYALPADATCPFSFSRAMTGPTARVTLTEDNRLAAFQGGNTLAVVDRAFTGGERAVWSFRIERDVEGNQGTVFGLVFRDPSPSFSYTDASMGVFWRAFNGNVTGPTDIVPNGTQPATNPYDNSIVTFQYDGVSQATVATGASHHMHHFYCCIIAWRACFLPAEWLQLRRRLLTPPFLFLHRLALAALLFSPSFTTDVIRCHSVLLSLQLPSPAAVRLLINGADQGVIARMPRSRAVRPAAGSYMSNRSVRLVQCELVDDFPRLGFGPATPVRPFSRAHCSTTAGLNLEDGETVLRSTSASTCIAAVNWSFGRDTPATAEGVAWSFRITDDRPSNEACIFGAIVSDVLPPPSWDYSTSVEDRKPGAYAPRLPCLPSDKRSITTLKAQLQLAWGTYLTIVASLAGWQSPLTRCSCRFAPIFTLRFRCHLARVCGSVVQASFTAPTTGSCIAVRHTALV